MLFCYNKIEWQSDIGEKSNLLCTTKESKFHFFLNISYKHGQTILVSRWFTLSLFNFPIFKKVSSRFIRACEWKMCNLLEMIHTLFIRVRSNEHNEHNVYCNLWIGNIHTHTHTHPLVELQCGNVSWYKTATRLFKW